ncbi:hypothetical protein D3C78_1888990 [compost metagenome]
MQPALQIEIPVMRGHLGGGGKADQLVVPDIFKVGSIEFANQSLGEIAQDVLMVGRANEISLFERIVFDIE